MSEPESDATPADEPARSSPPPANRRATRRRGVPRATHVECRQGTLGLGPNLAHAIADLSQTGASIVVSQALQKGQEVEIILTNAGQQKPLKLLAEVARSIPTEGNRFIVGVRFRKHIDFASFQRLL
jgi:c-di-GMP-binding flagellar brake protein YcgR